MTESSIVADYNEEDEDKTICDDCVGQKYCPTFKKYPLAYRALIYKCNAKVSKEEALEYFNKYTIKVIDEEQNNGKKI